jgi:hypothetical protein
MDRLRPSATTLTPVCQAIVFQLVRDCYEAVVITSFVWLLLQYVGDSPAEQNEVFSQVKLKKWVWPLGWWRYRPTGLHFLWIMKICILQYAIVRPVCTIVSCVAWICLSSALTGVYRPRWDCSTWACTASPLGRRRSAISGSRWRSPSGAR